MPESLKTKIMRLRLNFFPACRGTGARIVFIAGDWRKVRIKLPLSWRTRNYVGTIYGGSIYGAVDPIYMLMLIKILGPGYVVWDKAASIHFKKPGTSTLLAKFVITDEEISSIKTTLGAAPSVERIYLVDLVDAEGVVHAFIEKTLYIRKKDGASDGKPKQAGEDNRNK
jgi:acyl-coenzyme A thioesterase PaaI-like protein